MKDEAINEGIALIKQFEGCKLKAYKDIRGVTTIGYGATGPDVTPGLVWTQEQCDRDLRARVLVLSRQIDSLVTTQRNPHQDAALLSFCYNLGIGNFKRSGLLKCLNRGEYTKAADQFLLWDKVGNYPVKGLTLRRQKEREVFLS